MLSTGLVATSAEVGAFVSEHLGERAAKRKAAIDAALVAAEQRDREEAAVAPVMPAHWISPEDKDRPRSTYSVPTTLGVGSTIGPVKGNPRRTLLVVVVAVIGPVLGVAASLIVYASTRATAAAVAESPAAATTSAHGATSAPAPQAPPPPETAPDPAQSTSPSPDAAEASPPPVTTTTAAVRPAVARPGPPTPPSPRASAKPKIPTVIDNGF